MTNRILYEDDSMYVTYNPDRDFYAVNIGGRNFTSNLKTLEKIANTSEEDLEVTIHNINPDMVTELINNELSFVDFNSAVSKAINKRKKIRKDKFINQNSY